jgi:hypothetical protein
MTYINDASRVQADVARLTVTRDANGDVTSETFTQIYGTHWADIQPLANTDRIAAEQLKVEVTHRIFPEPYLGGVVALNDFFRSGSDIYRVMGINDFRDVAYYDALHGIAGT